VWQGVEAPALDPAAYDPERFVSPLEPSFWKQKKNKKQK
jgi:hypothetical protein